MVIMLLILTSVSEPLDARGYVEVMEEAIKEF